MLNIRSLAHWRPLPVYFMAASLPLSMAATSISKLLIALTGLAAIELQNQIPKGRVLYSSATGFSDVSNMASMLRREEKDRRN